MKHQYKMCYATLKAHIFTHKICQFSQQNAKKQGFRILGQKISTASPKK